MKGFISVLPPVYSWSQQRDQYVVDAPWLPEGLRRAEGRWAARRSSLFCSSLCVCPSSFSHFRDPCRILAGGPGRTWVSFSSPVENLMYSVRLPKGKQFFMLWWGRGHCRAGEQMEACVHADHRVMAEWWGSTHRGRGGVWADLATRESVTCKHSDFLKKNSLSLHSELTFIESWLHVCIFQIRGNSVQ